MMKNKIFKMKFRVYLVSALLIFATVAAYAGQYYKLQRLEVFNMGGYYRVTIQCNGPAKFVHKYFSAARRLSVYVNQTQLSLSKDRYFYKNGLVKAVAAVQFKKSPPVARIDIYLSEHHEYEVNQSIDGLINVDVYQRSVKKPTRREKSSPASKPKTTAVNQNLDAGQGNILSKTGALLNAASHNSTVIHENRAPRSPDLFSSTDKVTLDVKGADISNVLRLLAKQSKLNIVSSKDVQGEVTVSLAGVTIKEALEMVVKSNGLEYSINGDIVLVKPRENFGSSELKTKVYRLRYVDANNLKNTVSAILSEKAVVQVFNNDFYEVKNKDGKDDETGEKRRSSTLIVTDTPTNIQQVDAMIAALDVPTPQIMIEAKLLEISPQTQQQLGINWDKTINATIFKEILLPSGTPHQYVTDIPLDGGSVSYGTLSLERYSAVLDFLNSRTNSKLVSNPRIIAMDNQEAIISVGTTFPIPQINRGVGGQGDQVTFEYRDVNVSLKVTPHLADDETITLFVNPDIEEVIGQVEAAGSSAPITSKRSVKTVVNLRNNETMVIGGLIRENSIETSSKVWFLGDIPLIGNFFRHKSNSKIQTDLLIFITPRLVTNQ